MEFYYDAVDRDILILSADGGLMKDSAKDFVGELEHYIELGIRNLIVDCSGLTRITSYGIGILISIHGRMAKQGGDVKLAAVSGVVGKIIAVTKVGKLIHVYSTVDDARKAFGVGEGGGVSELESRHPELD